MLYTILDIIVPTITIILALVTLDLLVGLIFHLIDEFTDAPEWVEGAAILLTSPKEFKEWREDYQREQEEEEK